MGAPARTLFFGSGTFALPALEALIAAPSVDVVGVITAPPRPSGRKGALASTPVASAAERAAVDVSTPSRLRDADTLAALAAKKPALIVLADYGRLVPQAVLDLPEHGALNLHPSLLPRHRGATPVPAAILAGDTETGVTLMRMDAGLDTGPIIAQRSRALDGAEVAPELEATLAVDGAELLAETLEAWIAGEVPAVPQVESDATLTRPLRRPDGLLDPMAGAAALERQVRAYQPWPGSFIEGPDGRLIVWRADALAEGAHPGRPGDVIADGDGVALRTDDGRLRLVEVQPAGRKRMSGADYRRGQRS